MSHWRILTGDVMTGLSQLEPESVQTCVTSPPYWGLRDYGVEGQIGLEPTPEDYVASLVNVFREVRRVLKEDGTCWINLGDSYNSIGGTVGGGKNVEARTRTHRDWLEGLKPKDLVGIPWRVAFALQSDGWYLRSDIIWSKPNPMPESVTDRPTKAHEYIFLLSKSARYYYNAEAIAEAALWPDGMNGKQPIKSPYGQGFAAGRSDGSTDGTRNKRSVWHVATQPYPEAHFATYPEKLIEPCILAGSKEGDTVLDPFTGSGTTGAVAIRHQRNFIGCELNPSYVQLARKRIGDVAPLLAEERIA